MSSSASSSSSSSSSSPFVPPSSSSPRLRLLRLPRLPHLPPRPPRLPPHLPPLLPPRLPHPRLPPFHLSVQSRSFTLKGALRMAEADHKLNLAIEQAAKDLVVQGYAVVEDVLSLQECEVLHSEFWHCLHTASAGRLSRPRSAADLASFKKTGTWPSTQHGIFEDGEWAHMEMCYYVRTHPRVLHCFGRLHGNCEDLVVSCDRLNYQLPPEWLNRAPKSNPKESFNNVTEATWLHVDQALDKNQGLYCIQGLVTLTNATEPGDASLELVPGSHWLHQQMESHMDRKLDARQRASDWLKFSEGDKHNFDAKFVHKKTRQNIFSSFTSVRAKKGSLVLWDSRTWHQGGRIRACSAFPRPIAEPRFVIYVCAMPAKHGLSAAEKKKKKQAFEQHKATNHWPLFTTIFPKPRVYDKSKAPQFDFTSLLLQSPESHVILAHFFGLSLTSCPFVWASRPPLLQFHGDAALVLAAPLDTSLCPFEILTQVAASNVASKKRKPEDS